MSEEERTRQRFEPPQLWDDQAFRKRLADLARRKGVSVKAAMAEIGLTVEFAYRAADSRPSNLLMVVANYFGVSPAELAGWAAPPAPVESRAGFNHHQELTVRLAEIFSQQTAKMLFIALAIIRPGEIDPKLIATLASLIKTDLNELLGKDQQSGSG